MYCSMQLGHSCGLCCFPSSTVPVFYVSSGRLMTYSALPLARWFARYLDGYTNIYIHSPGQYSSLKNEQTPSKKQNEVHSTVGPGSLHNTE